MISYIFIFLATLFYFFELLHLVSIHKRTRNSYIEFKLILVQYSKMNYVIRLNSLSHVNYLTTGSDLPFMYVF